MNIKDIQLNGSNLCNVECMDKNAVLHPETCVSQVLINNGSTQTLSDWLAGDTESASGFDDYTNLLDWLNTNYPINITLPVATDTTLGILKVDTSDNILNINEGTLSFDKEALDIPVINNATISNSGTIKLGNSTQLNTALVDYSITGQIQDSYSYDEHNGHVFAFPLRVDSENRAAVTIPTKLFTGNKSITLPDWTFDWSKKVINVDTSSTETSGVETNYVLLGNKNNNTSNGELGYDDNGNLSTDYGYPRFALVAGDNISFTRYNNNFISNADNFWGDTITELLISANVEAAQYIAGDGIDITDGTISQEIATSTTVGGIKIGYIENDELKPVLLDEGNKAYVNISNGSLKNHEVTAINSVVYDERGNHFDTYTVRCNISNEDLTIVNINDFKQVGNGYSTVQNVNVNDVYEWSIGSAGDNNNIAIIHAISTSAKGCFQLTIDHGNNIVETHNVGFIIDTPSNYAFAWFSTCNWTVSLYGGGNIGDNACRVYLKVPSDFTGTVKITDIHLIAASGDNVGSMSGTTYKKWISNDPFDNGSVTNITGTQVSTPQTYDGKITVPTGCKVPVDSFVTLSEYPSVGDFLYDSEINDTLIHNLLTRVKAIELWIQNQQ